MPRRAIRKEHTKAMVSSVTIAPQAWTKLLSNNGIAFQLSNFPYWRYTEPRWSLTCSPAACMKTEVVTYELYPPNGKTGLK
jgi:hypothetical protein